MSNGVQISRPLLAALCAALLVLVIVVAFLLGRQSGTPPAVATLSPAPPPLAVSQAPADKSLSTRLDAIEKRVDDVKKRGGSTDRRVTLTHPASTPKGGTAASSARAYFQQVDAIVGGSSAIANPKPIVARLLEQAVSGSPAEFDRLYEKTSQARADLEAVQPPAGCAEHHRLLLRQLSDAVALLDEVRRATESGDTRELAALSARGEQMQGEATRLRDVDRSLRATL